MNGHEMTKDPEAMFLGVSVAQRYAELNPRKTPEGACALVVDTRSAQGRTVWRAFFGRDLAEQADRFSAGAFAWPRFAELLAFYDAEGASDEERAKLEHMRAKAALVPPRRLLLVVTVGDGPRRWGIEGYTWDALPDVGREGALATVRSSMRNPHDLN